MRNGTNAINEIEYKSVTLMNLKKVKYTKDDITTIKYINNCIKLLNL